MLSIFRTNNIFVSIFLFLYIIILRLPSFLFKNDIWQPENKGVLSEWVYHILGSSHSFAANTLACILLLFHSILINNIVLKHRMTSTQTLFPGLFYILAASTLPDFLYLSPILIANTFYILAIYYIFNIWRQNSASDYVFNIGLCIGLASLCYNSFILFIIWGIIGISSLRKLNFKEWFILLIGAFLPYVFAGTHYLWIDKYPEFFQKQIYDNYAFFYLYGKTNLSDYTKLGIFGFLILIMILSYGLYQTKKSTPITDYNSLIYWGMFFSGLAIFIQQDNKLDFLMILAVPIGFFISQNFIKVKNTVAETLHLLWFFFVLFAQYKGLLGF